MSEFGDKESLADAIDWIRKNDINKIDFSNVHEQEKIIEILEHDPNYFFELNEENRFEDACSVFVAHNPAGFNLLSDNQKTTKVKIALVSGNPENMIFLKPEDYSEEIVKFLYVNYTPLVEEFEDDMDENDKDDKKILEIIKKYIAKFKKQKIEIKYKDDEDELCQ